MVACTCHDVYIQEVKLSLQCSQECVCSVVDSYMLVWSCLLWPHNSFVCKTASSVTLLMYSTFRSALNLPKLLMGDEVIVNNSG